jgi:hypothetical protein
MKEWFDQKSVAIVGNAKSIFDNSYGSLIDSHDIVCRINQGAVILNEKAQGKKTDVFVFSGLKKFKNLITDIGIDKNLFISARKQNESLSIKNLTVYPIEWRNQLKNNLILLDKSFVNTGHPLPGEKGEIKKPSSGICTLDYVSKFNPNSVSVFGFDWKASPTYYNQGGYNTSHDWKYEKEYCLEYFQKQLNYKFYYEN